MALKNKENWGFGGFGEIFKGKEKSGAWPASEELFGGKAVLRKTPSGGLHAWQLHGGHRDHSQGVRGSLHSGKEHNGQIPPTTL